MALQVKVKDIKLKIKVYSKLKSSEALEMHIFTIRYDNCCQMYIDYKIVNNFDIQFMPVFKIII